MSVSAHRAFALLKELAYEKVSCSPEEKKAAQRLLEEARACGAEAHLEAFTVACGKVRTLRLLIYAGYCRQHGRYDIYQTPFHIL